MNHIHVGFKQEITPEFKLPAELAAGAQPAAVAAPCSRGAGSPPRRRPRRRPCAAPPDPKKHVRAVRRRAASRRSVAAAEAKEVANAQDSNLFLQAVQARDQQAAARVAAAPAAPEAPAPARRRSTSPTRRPTYPGDDAPKEQIAAWMAAEAEKRGLPPQLPVMAALVESGLKNVNFGDADSLGYFQMRVSFWDQGDYAGFADDPNKQIDWFLDQAEAVKAQRDPAASRSTTPAHFGEWIADVERPAEQFRGRYQLRLDEANGLLKAAPAAPAAPGADAVAPAAPAGAVGPGGADQSSLGAAALRIAQTQRGVREIGTNTGPQVDEYLEAAGVAPGNPWCASFLTWALEKSGHKMPGGGWAAVATWVRNAEQGGSGLKLVSAEEARPGDIVAYDFGGQSDFGADGHIGFLASSVEGGRFTALEGNNADAVNTVPREVGDANTVFIRVEGDAPAAGVPVAPELAAPPAAAVPAAAVPAAPAAPAAAVAAPPDPKKHSGLFGAVPQPASVAAAEAKEVSERQDSNLFLQAVQARPAAARPRRRRPRRGGTPRRDARRRRAAGRPGQRADDLPRRRRPEGADRRLDGRRGREARPPTPAPRHGRAGRIRPEERQLRRRRLARLLPDARQLLGPGRLRRLRRRPEQADRLVPRPGRAVKAQRESRNQPIDDPAHFGEWIADVERPAEQFRGRYQLRLDEANGLLKAARRRPPRPQRPSRRGDARGTRAPTRRRARGAAVDAPAPPAMAQGAGPRALAALKEAQKYTARRTSGAARRRRPASTAPASCSGRTRRRA